MKRRYVAGILTGLCLIMTVASGCGKKDSTNTETGKAESFEMTAEFLERDLNFSYDEESAVKIRLDGNTADVDGENAGECVTVSDNKVTIKKEGTYIVSGNYDNGTLVVDAGDDKVQVVLDGAEINNDSFSCFYVENADKVFLTLAEDSENKFSDGESYEYGSTEEEDSNGAVFAKDDLTINGTGKLEVEGNYKNGIVCKDDLKIVSAYISVNAKNNGIKGKDSLMIKDAEISVTAGNDGMKSDNDSDSEKGFVYIEDGNFNIEAEQDGIQAETGLIICDGTFNIVTGGGSANAQPQSDREQVGYQGMWKEEGYSGETEETSDSDSAKGLKAGVELDILDGKIAVDSKDDALHSNSLMVIENGTLNISTGDDGIHSDSELQIKDGNICIAKSYEGVESAVIRISGGELDITASDDGINAAGGELESDGNKGGKFGGMGGMMETSSGYLYISGGNILIRAEGDGIDTNTDGEMSGGYVVVYGPTNGGNGSLDYGNSFVITGGTLFTAGSADMAVAPTDGTTQNTIFANLSQTFNSGAVVQITSASGEALGEFTPETSFASIVFSDSGLKSDEDYNIVVNGENVATLTMTDTVTSYGSTGGMNGGMSGGMNGGMQGGMNNGQTPPELPDRENGMNNGQTPPEKPDGDNGMNNGMNGGQTPPEKSGGSSNSGSTL